MVTINQVNTLRRIRDYGVRSVVGVHPEVQPPEGSEIQLPIKSIYILGDDTEVPEKLMLKLLEKGLLKRDLRNLTEYGKEVVEQADSELGA